MEVVEQGLKVWEAVTKTPEMVIFLVPMGLLGFSLYVLLQSIQKR